MSVDNRRVRSSPKRKGLQLGMSERRKILKRGVGLLFLVYGFFTLLPFYLLFVRTFVPTKQATELHLWIPPQEAVNLDAQVGNLSVFLDLDLIKLKRDFGIPLTDYLPPRSTLRQVAEDYEIPLADVEAYFAPFGVYNGWINLLGSREFWWALLRTAAITAVSLVALNLLAVCTGYGLAGLRRKDQMLWYNLYLLKAILPPMLVILPQFLIVQWLLGIVPGTDTPGLTRDFSQLFVLVTLWAQGGALPAMLMTAAVESVPKELEEAAEIDGSNPLQYFWFVLLPLMRVPMASLTVIFLPLIWNDFLQPYIYLDRSNTTLLPLIQAFSGQYTSNFQVTYTGVFVSILPLVLVYLLFRRWFVQGALAGAVKG